MQTWNEREKVSTHYTNKQDKYLPLMLKYRMVNKNSLGAVGTFTRNKNRKFSDSFSQNIFLRFFLQNILLLKTTIYLLGNIINWKIKLH